jgi:riboflavin biosynthesis pyrimidine reductase
VQIGGPTLAAAMLDRIDEFRAILYPTAVGGGTPFFPAGVRLDLKLVECRRFDSGPVLLRYQRA